MSTQRKPKALRVFIKIYAKNGMNKYGDWRWKCHKRAFDFHPDKPVSEAEAGILREYGERRDLSRAAYVNCFAEIVGHKLVYDFEEGKVETWKAEEQSIFAPEVLKACLGRKP